MEYNHNKSTSYTEKYTMHVASIYIEWNHDKPFIKSYIKLVCVLINLAK